MLRNCSKTLDILLRKKNTFLKPCVSHQIMAGFLEDLKRHISDEGLLNFYPSYRYAATIQTQRKKKSFIKLPKLSIFIRRRSN